MDPRTVKFICFAAFGGAALWAGYAARKRQWVREEVSRHVHLHTVVWVWSSVSLLSLWVQPLRWRDAPLAMVQVILVGASALAAVGVCRALRLARPQIAAVSISSGLGNLGFTLGGYVCYVLLTPHATALGIAIAYVTVMQVAGVVLLYPLARHYSQHAPGDVGLGRLILSGLWDVRAAPLYGALLGEVLGTMKLPVPGAVGQWHLIDILFYLGSFGGYFGIGLRLRLGDSLKLLKGHAVAAGVKFVFIPLLTVAMLMLLAQLHWPLSPTARQVALVEAAMPTAIQSVMIANLFHLDSRQASSLWLWNTVLFFILGFPLVLLVVAGRPGV